MKDLEVGDDLGLFGWAQSTQGGFPGDPAGKESACSEGDAADLGSIPGSGRCPWGRPWQPTSLFVPGEFYGQRSLVGYSPWGHKESDATEVT